MHTLRLSGYQPKDIEKAAQLLRAAQIVAFPTETVYGLGADATNPYAVAKIFTAKDRPDFNPLIVHVYDLEAAWPLWDLSELPHAEQVKTRIQALAEAFWPGPLTIVCEKSSVVSETITAGSAKVAVRIPAAHIARQLIKAAGVPLVAPSANAHKRPSPTMADHVLLTLDGKIDAVLDGGSCSFGIESTVVDVSASPPVVLRSGALSLAELQQVLPDIKLAQDKSIQKSSPGMQDKHYAPQLPQVYLADLNALKKAWIGSSSIIVTETSAALLMKEFGARESGFTRILANDPEGFATKLYDAFYRAENFQSQALAVEEPPLNSAWDSVRDKLLRATHK